MIDRLVLEADAAQNARRYPDAERLVKQALALEPDHGRALTVLAQIEAKTGRQAEAIARFHSILEKDPFGFDAVFWLSVLYRGAGNHGEAVRFAQQAIELRPLEAHVQSNLGLCFLAVHDLDKAVTAFERSKQLNPRIPMNLHHLGMAYQLQGRDHDSIAAFEQALRLAPNMPETLAALGQALLNRVDTEGAIRCAERLLTLNPKSASAHLLLASALIAQGRAPDAEAHIDLALALDPNGANGQAMLGLRYQALGRLDEANQRFKNSARLRPEQGFAYCAFMRNHRVTDEDAEMVAEMESLVGAGKVPARGLSYLHFGLGKAYEDLKHYEQAMAHFDEANRLAYRLRFGEASFDRDKYAKTFDWTIKTFSKEFLESYRHEGLETDCPIFIVGMMRSGTTLVEQILSSHPLVNARGELPFWMQRRQSVMAVGETKLDVNRLRQVAETYFEFIHHLGPEAPHLTDKMPDNFLLLGLIHLAFPNCKIVHTIRNPVDTCISIYTTPNRTAVEYANNKDNIVFAYEQYRRLMAHWRNVIPADRLLDLRYEELISDRDAVTRRLIGFCGLEWDEACLHPEDNERTVATPSVWQVRQPVYSTSVERWRKYEPWLGAFAKLR